MKLGRDPDPCFTLAPHGPFKLRWRIYIQGSTFSWSVGEPTPPPPPHTHNGSLCLWNLIPVDTDVTTKLRLFQKMCKKKKKLAKKKPIGGSKTTPSCTKTHRWSPRFHVHLFVVKISRLTFCPYYARRYKKRGRSLRSIPRISELSVLITRLAGCDGCHVSNMARLWSPSPEHSGVFPGVGRIRVPRCPAVTLPPACVCSRVCDCFPTLKTWTMMTQASQSAPRG